MLVIRPFSGRLHCGYGDPTYNPFERPVTGRSSAGSIPDASRGNHDQQLVDHPAV
jgi:hypothetical protein